MLIFDKLHQLWWLRAAGVGKEYSVPTWLAHKWVQMGMPHREE